MLHRLKHGLLVHEQHQKVFLAVQQPPQQIVQTVQDQLDRVSWHHCCCTKCRIEPWVPFTSFRNKKKNHDKVVGARSLRDFPALFRVCSGNKESAKPHSNDSNYCKIDTGLATLQKIARTHSHLWARCNNTMAHLRGGTANWPARGHGWLEVCLLFFLYLWGAPVCRSLCQQSVVWSFFCCFRPVLLCCGRWW